MTYLLDTNAWIAFLNPGSKRLTERVMANADAVALCSVVKGELYYGAFHSERRDENLVLLRDLFGQFPSLAFEDADAEVAGRVRAELAREGTPIGPYDLQIAAIALRHELTLVSNNTSEFSRVDGLHLADWTE